MPSSEDIKHAILSLDSVRRWPELVDLVRRGGHKRADSIPCWEYPLLACEAVGSPGAAALPAMAATTCLLSSIHLLDDLLDEDPKGLQHTVGVGTAANLAAAFQAAAGQVMASATLSEAAHRAAQESVVAAAMDTAWGQHLDTRELGDRDPEAAYWQASATKTPPLFASALFLGALCGGADVATAQRIAGLAEPIGKVVQAGDDMTDALATPAKPDWRSGWNNLVILFALEADHPDRQRFHQLRQQVHQPGALEEAQRILVRCGAISYGCYHVIEGYNDACKRLRAMGLPHPESLGCLLESLVLPSRNLFVSHNIETPEALETLEAWRR